MKSNTAHQSPVYFYIFNLFMLTLLFLACLLLKIFVSVWGDIWTTLIYKICASVWVFFIFLTSFKKISKLKGKEPEGFEFETKKEQSKTGFMGLQAGLYRAFAKRLVNSETLSW